jgi:hypothetical protein
VFAQPCNLRKLSGLHYVGIVNRFCVHRVVEVKAVKGRGLLALWKHLTHSHSVEVARENFSRLIVLAHLQIHALSLHGAVMQFQENGWY